MNWGESLVGNENCQAKELNLTFTYFAKEPWIDAIQTFVLPFVMHRAENARYKIRKRRHQPTLAEHVTK